MKFILRTPKKKLQYTKESSVSISSERPKLSLRLKRIRQLVQLKDHQNLYREFGLYLYPNGDRSASGVQNFPNGLYHPTKQDEKIWGEARTPKHEAPSRARVNVHDPYEVGADFLLKEKRRWTFTVPPRRKS